MGEYCLEYLYCAEYYFRIHLWNSPGSEVKKVADGQTANKWQSQGSCSLTPESAHCTAHLYIYRCYQPILGVLGCKHFTTFKRLSLGEVRSWFSNLPCIPTTLHSPLHTGLPCKGEHPCRAVPFEQQVICVSYLSHPQAWVLCPLIGGASMLPGGVQLCSPKSWNPVQILMNWNTVKIPLWKLTI